MGIPRDPTWYPFTQMSEFADASPLSIVAGEGCELVDADGVRYLDGVSSLWANIHGHRHPRIDAAVREQLDRIAHSTLLGLSHPLVQELSRRLVEVAPPGLTRVFYSDSGATANEIAVKLAFQYMQLHGRPERTRFIHLTDGYHGDTLGAVSVGGIDAFHGIFGPLLFETVSVPSPHRLRRPGMSEHDWRTACCEAAAAAVHEHGDTSCAFIVEPLMQGAAGMLAQPAGFLSFLRELTRRHDMLLIVDEVATGFGRTGRMFACEHEGVSPDLLCLGKGLTGGYLPLAATLASEEIFSAFLGPWEEGKQFFHGHTYTGNPLACAAAVASLDVFADDRVIEGLPPKLERYAAGMRRLAGLPGVKEVRYRGMMGGVELCRPDGEPWPAARRTGHRVILEARKRGVMLRPLGDVLIILPPLAVDCEHIDRIFDAADAAIETTSHD